MKTPNQKQSINNSESTAIIEDSPYSYDNILLLKNKNQPNSGKLVIKDSLTFIKVLKKPKKPVKNNYNEKKAISKLDNYKPSVFERLFFLANKELKWLEHSVEVAIVEDEKEFNLMYEDYLVELEIWNRLNEHSVKYQNN